MNTARIDSDKQRGERFVCCIDLGISAWNLVARPIYVSTAAFWLLNLRKWELGNVRLRSWQYWTRFASKQSIFDNNILVTLFICLLVNWNKSKPDYVYLFICK